MSLETEVEILKKEVQDIKQIHLRLDTAIEKSQMYLILSIEC